MTFTELLQNYANLSYESLVAKAQGNLRDAAPALKVALGDAETVADFLVATIGACLGADGGLSALEARFINEVLDNAFDADTLLSMTASCGDEETKGRVDAVIDALATEAKIALCSFCTCVMAVDETISRGEIAFLAQLLA